MKKSYQIPETILVMIETMQMIAESEQSRNQNGIDTDIKVNEPSEGPGDSFDMGQNGGIRSKGVDIWDDWD